MASTTTAQEIVDDAEEILQDILNDRWDVTEHLAAVNNGSKEICLHKPDAYIISVSQVLAAGIVQLLPAAGHQLMEITSNMGTDGTTQGATVRLIDRKILDAMNPNWPTITATAIVKYYMYDERNPTRFLVCPPQPISGFGYLQIFYAATPAEIAIGDAILIPDIYRSALTYYVLYSACQKDADHVQNQQRAVMYYQAFLNVLGVKQGKEEAEDPNIR